MWGDFKIANIGKTSELRVCNWSTGEIDIGYNSSRNTVAFSTIFPNCEKLKFNLLFMSSNLLNLDRTRLSESFSHVVLIDDIFQYWQSITEGSLKGFFRMNFIYCKTL